MEFLLLQIMQKSYERMIKYITKAEKELTKKSKFIRVSKYVEKKN